MHAAAEFKSARLSNFGLGIGLLALSGCIFWLVIFVDEESFLNTRVRRGGGLIKTIEQTIGWDLFCVLMALFGFWILVYALVSLWKAVDGTADVRASDDLLVFHPAVKGTPATYDEVSHWSIEHVSGNPVVWLHFYESYWSLQGLFKRRTVKLEGSREQLEPLVNSSLIILRCN